MIKEKIEQRQKDLEQEKEMFNQYIRFQAKTAQDTKNILSQMNHENYVNRDYLIQLQNQQKTQNEKEKSFYEGKKDYTETLRKSLER